MSSTLGASLLRTVLSDGTLKILGSGLDKGPIINSPLYAKSTTRGFGRTVAATADLRVEQVIVYNKIPESCRELGVYNKLCK